MKENMAKHAKHFTNAERAVICASVRQHHPTLVDCHPGMFGLLGTDTVLNCLSARVAEIKGSGVVGHVYVTKLLAKCRTILPVNKLAGKAVFLMYLSDIKMAKRIRQWRSGVGILNFPGPTKVVEYGMKWSVGHRDWVRDEKTVQPSMEVKLRGLDGMWQITVDRQYVEVAQTYLAENCI